MDYWGFDKDTGKDEFYEELLDFIACKYLQDGYFDSSIEGVVIDGHSGRSKQLNININEIL